MPPTDVYVGFFWFLRCFALWWARWDDDKGDDKNADEAVCKTYVDKARDPRRKNGGKDRTILREDSPIMGVCGSGYSDDLYDDDPPRKEKEEDKKRKGGPSGEDGAKDKMRRIEE
jgi:hypothetical protein